MPSVNLIDMFCRLTRKYEMQYWTNAEVEISPRASLGRNDSIVDFSELPACIKAKNTYICSPVQPDGTKERCSSG